MKVRVDVMPRQGVLDPQGKAIAHALTGQGFLDVADVRMGKVIILDLAETDPAKAKDAAKTMAEKLLANLVVEDYQITVL
jgi:phosphoribosylformylglycinamidine synthase